ncbi:MAG: hypothetical protein R3E48_10875 [Burkholderiaceae bacterium]
MFQADINPIQAIRALFDAHGALIYGERVNQRQHALQCGTLAERAGASPGWSRPPSCTTSGPSCTATRRARSHRAMTICTSESARGS